MSKRHKIKLLGPETCNILIINAETVAEIRTRHSRTTHPCIIEIHHDRVDVELPAGFATELLAATGAPASGVLRVKIWPGVSVS
jgi:hypothetical protein